MTAAATPVPSIPGGVLDRLRELQARWAKASPAERSNYQLYLIELTEALGVRRPMPAMPGDVEAPETAYRFDYPISIVARTGEESTNFIDLFYGGHFALEAKDQDVNSSASRLLVKAFGQVNSYARDLPERPPYIMVLDVGKTLIVWDRWSGSYGGFNAGRRIELTRLADNPDDVRLLRDIWSDPSSRDPRAKAQAVTKDIAGRLAKLAAALEDRGHDQERVARFLMRCVFSCFAEDIQLLPDEVFRKTVQGLAERGTPEQFSTAVTGLWKAMDEGGWFGALELRRFNGHFFKTVEALPLTREDIALLVHAAQANWASVEPSIFGTLLVRALDPQERHRIGAEYTPRAFIERVVRPTVEDPIRERWTLVQAEVLQLRERAKPADIKKAEKSLREFHGWLRGLRFLDPACGSGNFLYVTLDIVKRVEAEVIKAISELTGQHALRFDEVGPWQFYGIEVNQWAREIAELTLWIGFHQFWKEHHDVQPDEPILQDTGTLERRDAVLTWDDTRHLPSRDIPDPTPRIVSPSTGKLVPDPTAKLPYIEYTRPRKAAWPQADFIIGNPPYLGKSVKRKALGNGYVDAVQAAYPEVAPAADYVMLWWYRAAKEVAEGRTIRAGLITTNSIKQAQSRTVIESAEPTGARVAWAIPDHPWVDSSDGAAVRVAMTVIARDPTSAVSITVDRNGQTVRQVRTSRLNSDMSAGADVARCRRQPLKANRGIATVGYKLYGDGFVLDGETARRLLAASPRNADVIHRYYIGDDLTTRPRDVYLIDFGARSATEAQRYPQAYSHVVEHVRQHRVTNPNQDIAGRWWQLGHRRDSLRAAIAGLSRYIATPETAKHRFFQFLDCDVAPEGSLFCIASDDPAILGVVSSSVHLAWASRAAGNMGVGNDPRYNQGCFAPFPFPEMSADVRKRVGDLAEDIDGLRKQALAASTTVTMTGMYNVVAKLRNGAELTAGERQVSALAACPLIRERHDELDRAVRSAYGFVDALSDEEVLIALVALHDTRMDEEKRGQVRWLRPDYQRTAEGEVTTIDAADEPEGLPLEEPQRGRGGRKVTEPTPTWPRGAIDQIAALKRLATQAPITVDQAVKRFSGAKREIVARHLETLAILGELRAAPDGSYGRAATTY